MMSQPTDYKEKREKLLEIYKQTIENIEYLSQHADIVSFKKDLEIDESNEVLSLTEKNTWMLEKENSLSGDLVGITSNDQGYSDLFFSSSHLADKKDRSRRLNLVDRNDAASNRMNLSSNISTDMPYVAPTPVVPVIDFVLPELADYEENANPYVEDSYFVDEVVTTNPEVTQIPETLDYDDMFYQNPTPSENFEVPLFEEVVVEPAMSSMPIPPVIAAFEAPEIPSAPVVPSMPTPPVLPTFETPEVPSAPVVPSMPTPPEVPSVPVAPSMPTPPVLPTFETPEVPPVPVAPSMPTPPVLPTFETPEVPPVPVAPTMPTPPTFAPIAPQVNASSAPPTPPTFTPTDAPVITGVRTSEKTTLKGRGSTPKKKESLSPPPVATGSNEVVVEDLTTDVLKKIKNKRVLNVVLTIVSYSILIVGVMLFLLVGMQGPTDTPREIGGFTLLRMTSDRLEPEVAVDSLMLMRIPDPADLEVGQIVSFLVDDYSIDIDRIREINRGNPANTSGVFFEHDAENLAAAPVLNIIGTPVFINRPLGNVLILFQEHLIVTTAGILVVFVGILIFQAKIKSDLTNLLENSRVEK